MVIPYSIKIPHSLALAITVLASQAVYSQAQDVVEEIVVTGSYIRGSATDAPSPVQVIGRDQFDGQGATDMWSVIKNLGVNSGSTTNASVAAGVDEDEASAGTANINLRNLGTNSTLVLVNGKRQVSSATLTKGGDEYLDLNTIPMVMIDRMEILTDGGSALYGSDAVAGVVNIVLRTEYEGLEVRGNLETIDGSGEVDETASIIWGWASNNGNTHFVLAAEAVNAEPVKLSEASYWGSNAESVKEVFDFSSRDILTAPFFGGNVNPAWINQELTALTGRTQYTDPQCEQLGYFTETNSVDRSTPNTLCLQDISDIDLLTVGSERESIHVSFTHNFNESVEFYSLFQYSQNQIETPGFQGGTGGRGVMLAAPGAHGANPFGRAAELGSQAAFAGLIPPTFISNAPISLANGGLGVPILGRGNSQAPLTDDARTFSDTETSGARMGLKGNFEFLDRDLEFDVSYSFSSSSFEQEVDSSFADRVGLGLAGLGGPNCAPNGRTDFPVDRGPYWGAFGDPYVFSELFPGYPIALRESVSLGLTSTNQGQGDCMFFNPFLTRFTDPNLSNSPELLDWMSPLILFTDQRNRLGVFDAVVSGDLVEVPGGMSQFAFGFQFREQNNKAGTHESVTPGIPNAIAGYDEVTGIPNSFEYATNNRTCSLCIIESDATRLVRAWFAEASVPVIDKVETQIALRYEDYGGNIGSSVSPKIGVSWRPIEPLMVRGSYSQAFRAANVGILNNGTAANVHLIKDYLLDPRVRAGLLPPTLENAVDSRAFSIGSPSPNIGNENSDTYNLGFLWTPSGTLEGLSIGADFWRFELEDRVVPEPPANGAVPETQAFITAAADTSNNYVTLSSLARGVVGDSCNPVDLETQFGRDSTERADCVVDPLKYLVTGVGRNYDNRVPLHVSIGAINAGEIITDGVDVNIGYDWANDWGQFRIGLEYTHVRQYELSGIPGLENGLVSTGVTDAAGTTGNGSTVRSLPDNKGNINLNWSRNNHSVTAITRIIGSYRDLYYDAEFNLAPDAIRPLMSSKIDTYQTWDFQYNYSHEWANVDWGTALFAVGVIDAFEEDIPYRRDLKGQNYDSYVFDPRGRRIYARATLQF